MCDVPAPASKPFFERDPTMRLSLAILQTAFLSLVAFASPALAQTIPVRVGVIPIIGAAPIFVANGEG
jgi:ABC-type nitrate/sulfonate/bicarbonate transport system substrate-binding protein